MVVVGCSEEEGYQSDRFDPHTLLREKGYVESGHCRWGKSYLCALLPNLGVQCQWNDAN